MIYLILFFITSILFYAAQQLKDTSKVAFYVLSYLAIFLLALVAGCRDNTIGTDVTVYEDRTFNLANHSGSPITDAFGDLGGVEPFFYILNYIASLFGDLGTALFLIMFVQTLFVFYGMKFYMDRAPLWMLMLAYDFLFYNTTLNIMRQGIAVAFMLFSYQYVEKRKLIKLLLMAILSFFWHKTGAVAFIMLFGIYFISWRSESTQKKLFFILIPSCIFAIASLSIIMKSLVEAIPIMNRFSDYTEGVFKAKLSASQIGAKLFLAGLALFMYLNKTATQRQLYIFLILIIFDLSSRFLGLYAFFATRFAYYFEIIEIPLLFEMMNSNKIKRNTRLVLSNLILLYFGLTYLRYFLYLGEHLTYPYVSRVYNITFY